LVSSDPGARSSEWRKDTILGFCAGHTVHTLFMASLLRLLEDPDSRVFSWILQPSDADQLSELLAEAVVRAEAIATEGIATL
jgi:hypothetical protein